MRSTNKRPPASQATFSASPGQAGTQQLPGQFQRQWEQPAPHSPLSLPRFWLCPHLSGFLKSNPFLQVDLAGFLYPEERTKDLSFSLPKIFISREASSVPLDHGQGWQRLHLNSPYKPTTRVAPPPFVSTTRPQSPTTHLSFPMFFKRGVPTLQNWAEPQMPTELGLTS